MTENVKQRIMLQSQNIFFSLIHPIEFKLYFEDVYKNYNSFLRYNKVLSKSQHMKPLLREYYFQSKMKFLGKKKINSIQMKSLATEELVLCSNEELVKWFIYDENDQAVMSCDSKSLKYRTICLSNLKEGSYYIEFLMDHGTIFTNHFKLAKTFLGLN